LLLVCSACTVIGTAAPKLQEFKTVGIVSAVGDTLTVTKAGLTGLENDERSYSIEPWGIDDLIVSRASALLSPHFQVQPVTYRRADFAALEREGIAAEARVLKATGNINTHRGAIFSLGSLCAAAGALAARGEPLRPLTIRRTLLEQWGAALTARALRMSSSHGASAARRFGLRSVGTEAALGFPVLFETTFPVLQNAMREGMAPQLARVQALFHTIAILEDTNLAHRGGLAGLRYAQRAARDFLRAGGANRAGGLDAARSVQRAFVARNLSPGGAADLLAAACWLQRLQPAGEAR